MRTTDGRTIKYGRLIRGGYLGHLSSEDIAILNGLKITDIIDFRSEREFKNRSDYILDNVTYHNFPCMNEKIKPEDKNNADGNLLWFVDNKNLGHKHMIDSYRDFAMTEIARKAYSNFFILLLSKDNGTFYYHCSQGKDRAGMASYLLEIALGVSKEDAIEDYLFSNIAMEIRVKYLLEQEKNKPYYNEEYAKCLHEVFVAKIDYLNAAIEAMEELSGNTLNFIKEYLKVDIEKLRKMYLE